LGSNGYVGRRILSAGTAQHIPLCISRITNENDLLRFEQEVQHAIEMHPDAAVVNCLGVRSSSRKNMELLNVRVPETLVKVSQKSEMPLIHFGSAAEIIEIIPNAESVSSAVPPKSLLYSQTKLRGTQVVLSHKNAVVLRLYNLHGLPHQTNSGLHQLCLRIRAILNNDPLEAIVDTTRDYVHWRTLPVVLDMVLRSRMTGLVEVCSGFGLSMSDIVQELPQTIRDEMSGLLIPADYFSPVIGTNDTIDFGTITKQEVAMELSHEVLSCAYS